MDWIRRQKYPIGIQTFSEIIEEGYTYVDKTGFIVPLLSRGKHFFLSRPRRFGKSLLLSMLQAYFEGRRELFKGLAVYAMDVDWTPSPVLHFDLNSGEFLREDGLEALIGSYLFWYEKEYGVDTIASTIPQRFANLIRAAYEKTGRKVIILIDEYDKPLLQVEEHKELFYKHQALLKGFYGNLKSMDSSIRLSLLTGVARFNKVSIFSDLNNLRDISLADEYADICGWTEEELLSYFQEGIEDLAKHSGQSVEETIKKLRTFYDGYRFSKNGSRLYNPYSVLTSFEDMDIAPNWFQTGTPTFLARRVKNQKIDLPTLNSQWASQTDLLEVGMDDANPIPLMFQTGYLTIDHYEADTELYLLRFPNREVEIGFARYLYPLYVRNGDMWNNPFSWLRFRTYLAGGQPEEFLLTLQTLLKGMPYEDQSESTYRSIVWMLGTLCSTQTDTEVHSYKGRSDLEIKTRNYVYVFEFKYNRSVEEAMAQLRDQDYAGRYALDPRKVYLIGVSFTDTGDNRGLTSYEIQPLR